MTLTTATVKNTREITISINGMKKRVWKVQVTDEISSNSTSTYYIDPLTRKIPKQEISVGGRNMVMELVE